MLFILALQLACAVQNDNAHTTATTFVPPPERQVLRVVTKPGQAVTGPITDQPLDTSIDPKKPYLTLHLQDGAVFPPGAEVPLSYSVTNAKLRADGGDFRVRYIIDDDEMKWLDKPETIWLAGWTPGKHTVRVELIGPDGWPFRNGSANIVTREISILPAK